MQKVVILTALSIERKAVLAFLTQRQEMLLPSGTIYQQGIFTTEKGSWNIAVAQVGMGNIEAAILVQEVIHYLAPEILFFLGIAGGLKNVELGDVVVAHQVYQYASGKTGIDFRPRTQVGLSSYRLVQRARAVAINDEWQRRIQNPESGLVPRAFIGAIAAGEQVLASRGSATWELLQRYYTDALAVEMEGYGALEAVHTNQPMEAIVIRGISDTLDNKIQADGNFQDIAARHASAFAFEMLSKMEAGAASTPNAVVFSPPTRVPRIPRLPVKIFYSYANEDREIIDAIKQQLVVLNKDIAQWDRTCILPGTDARVEWDRRLKEADIIILCISASYVSSGEYDEIDHSGILTEHEGLPIVIPLLIHRIFGLEDLTANLMVLPRNRKPIADNRAALLFEVAEEIGKVVKQLQSGEI